MPTTTSHEHDHPQAGDGRDWAGYAARQIQSAGLRRSGARQMVIDMLGEQSCALTALQIDEKLPKVGRATVYRAIEQLEDLDLIHRVDLGGSAFGYEKVDPTGDHHHHIVCDQCGKVEPFADERLEKAIHEVRRSGFKISSHEITLKGTCKSCN